MMKLGKYSNSGMRQGIVSQFFWCKPNLYEAGRLLQLIAKIPVEARGVLFYVSENQIRELTRIKYIICAGLTAIIFEKDHFIL